MSTQIADANALVSYIEAFTGSSNDDEIKHLLMELFRANGNNISLPLNDVRIYESDSFKLKLHEQIKQYHEHNQIIHLMYIFLSKDLKFYRNLLETFDPTWQKIQNNLNG